MRLLRIAINKQLLKLGERLQSLFIEARKYKSAEDLLKHGGFSIEALDRVAFGFAESDIKTLKPQQLTVKYPGDMENPVFEQKQSGLSTQQWAKSVNLSEPIEVSYEGGKFNIEDGHHRYYAAKILNMPLKVNLTIKDKPIAQILEESNYNYDQFHRDVWDMARQA
jgi:hypothetical protein